MVCRALWKPDSLVMVIQLIRDNSSIRKKKKKEKTFISVYLIVIASNIPRYLYHSFLERFNDFLTYSFCSFSFFLHQLQDLRISHFEILSIILSGNSNLLHLFFFLRLLSIFIAHMVKLITPTEIFKHFLTVYHQWLWYHCCIVGYWQKLS